MNRPTHRPRHRRRTTRTPNVIFASLLVLATGAVGVSLTVMQEDPEQGSAESGAVALSTATLPTITPPPTPVATKPGPEVTEVAIPVAGDGMFTVADGASTQGAAGRAVTYQVEVEGGVPFDADQFATHVDKSLTERRGWSKNGAYTFNRRSQATQRIVLASPTTVDRLCAPLQTRGEVSCRNGNVVAINALRWAKGAGSYGNDLKGYRNYVINHEVGHLLGFNHQPCSNPGRPAPVMHQQTLGLNGCTKNPWP